MSTDEITFVSLSDESLADTIELACDIRGEPIDSAHDTEDGIIEEIDAKRKREREMARRRKITLPRVSFLDATPERLRHANDNHRMADNGVRVIEDDPLDRMYKRGQLDANPDYNETLYAAGRRYYTDWCEGGMVGVGAMNYEKPIVSGGSNSFGVPLSERMAIRRQAYAKARAAVPKRLIGILEAVVLDGRTLSDAGIANTKHKSQTTAGAVAGERLQMALEALAYHYGLHARRAA